MYILPPVLHPKKKPMKFLYTVGGNVNYINSLENSLVVSKKSTHMRSLVFRTALFLIAEN